MLSDHPQKNVPEIQEQNQQKCDGQSKHKFYLKTGKVIQRISLMIGLLTLILPMLFWKKIPEQIPSHYNAAGIADHYSDKSILILILFLVVILMGSMGIAVYYVKEEINSKYTKEADISQMYRVYQMLVIMNLLIQCMFAYITFCSASGKMLGRFFLPIALIATFFPIVLILLQKVQYDRENFRETSRLLQIEQQEQGIKYRSKVDWWLGLLLGGSVVLMIYVTVAPLFLEKNLELGMIIISALTLLFILPLFFMKYVFYSTHLLVSCGVYGKERIEYSAIRHFKETKNPISSAALSLDRLQIDYIKNGYHQTVLISPVCKKEFMKRLEQYRKENARED